MIPEFFRGALDTCPLAISIRIVWPRKNHISWTSPGCFEPTVLDAIGYEGSPSKRSSLFKLAANRLTRPLHIGIHGSTIESSASSAKGHWSSSHWILNEV